VKEIANFISQFERQRAAIDRAISALREVEGVKAADRISWRGHHKEAPKRLHKRDRPYGTKESRAKKASKKAAALPVA
jgi:hypothetical protein